MELATRGSGDWIVLSAGKIIFEIKQLSTKRDKPLCIGNGRLIYTEKFWVARSMDSDYKGLNKYKSLERLLLVEFPFGFTNRPGALAMVDKVYKK